MGSNIEKIQTPIFKKCFRTEPLIILLLFLITCIPDIFNRETEKSEVYRHDAVAFAPRTPRDHEQALTCVGVLKILWIKMADKNPTEDFHEP